VHVNNAADCVVIPHNAFKVYNEKFRGATYIISLYLMASHDFEEMLRAHCHI